MNITRKELLHSGKANDVFATNMPGIIEIEFTDRVSAENGARMSTIAGKGKANCLISSTIFQRLEKAGIATHYLEPGSNDQSIYVVRAIPIPLEVIFRFEVAGSFAKHYHLKPGTKFTSVFVEYTYKDDEAGDPRISEWSIVRDEIVDDDQLLMIHNITVEVACAARKFFYDHGAKLIDGKLEFGFLPNGDIILMDEISPDTVRIVDAKTGESLDKDRFRKNLVDVSLGYTEMSKRLAQSEVDPGNTAPA